MTHAIGRAWQTLVISISSAFLLSAPAWGQGQEDESKYTIITGTGQALYRLAIPPVLDGGQAAEQAKTLQQVLNNDLTLIGLFKVVDPKGYLADLAKEGIGIDPQPWANVGAQGVVKARARVSGGALSVDFYLYDVAKGQSPVLKKTLSGKPGAARLLAHRFGNEVVQFYTGEKGIFTTKIAFSSGDPKKKVSYIYAMDYDGHGVHRVSRTGKQNVLPRWSPDGRIAYTSFLWNNPDLYVVGGGGGRASRISNRPGLNIGGAWSPAGNALALTLSKDGNAEIYRISPDGKIQARLTNNPGIDTSPSWSPDGSRIAFVSSRGGTPQIYVMSASGGEARRITFRGNYNQEPSWCPRKDVNLVAFTGRDDKGAYDIFTVNIDTGEVKRLTQGQGSNKSASWAPNGRLLVYSSSRGGLWIMDSDGLNQHRIYRGGGQTPSWSW